MEDQAFTLVEDHIPLAGLEETARELVGIFGGTMKSVGDDEMRFILPERRGVAASGGVEFHLRWEEGGSEGGTVTLTGEREVAAPKLQSIAVLLVGVVGALFFLVWPFFPNLGAVSWVGGILALGAYFITLRHSKAGVAADLLSRLADTQRVGRNEEETPESEPPA
ncbi:MAG: hypothetical protein WBX15_21010 [Thermoanaerobaculia bacterium]